MKFRYRIIKIGDYHVSQKINSKQIIVSTFSINPKKHHQMKEKQQESMKDLTKESLQKDGQNGAQDLLGEPFEPSDDEIKNTLTEIDDNMKEALG